MAGFTSVRELLGYGGDVARAVELGRIPSPHVYSAYSALSITGGHFDIQTVPISMIRDACMHETAQLAVCDGVEGCIRMVRQVIRRGAKVIKVSSTGGVL